MNRVPYGKKQKKVTGPTKQRTLKNSREPLRTLGFFHLKGLINALLCMYLFSNTLYYIHKLIKVDVDFKLIKDKFPKEIYSA